jgi:hypothetical protein
MRETTRVSACGGRYLVFVEVLKMHLTKLSDEWVEK